MTLIASAAGEPIWVDEVLRFWFAQLPPQQWFSPEPATDALVRERFTDLWQQLATTYTNLAPTGRSLLAAIVVLDQFPRNMFRGTSRAYETDPIALKLARDVVRMGLDASMKPPERLFLYLPFQHSEERADQARSVELYMALGNAEWTQFALEHQKVIERFGRFPHRNQILGRPSTAAEIELLREPQPW